MEKVLAILIIIFTLVGCVNNQGGDAITSSSIATNEMETSTAIEKPFVPKETTNNISVYNIDPSTENKYTVVVSEFDLGYKEYLSNAGKIMPYHIKGIIGVPEGEGTFPLILITHGSHSNDDESKRFDTGYDYLVNYFAENGYVVVSMDMSKPYIWKYGDNDDNEKSIPVANEHMESLMKANEGNNPGYQLDLKGKIDFERVGLIGHSRGGETIFDIATDQVNRGIDIKAILSIAPTLFFEKEWLDTDVAILVPEYDGDVIGLDGFNMYRILNAEGWENRNRYVTLLKGANHNYFNRNIERNDALMRSSEDISDQLTREEQESFLMKYAVGFFDSVFHRKTDNFISAKNPQPNKMYGFDVKTMFRTNQARELVHVDTTDDFTSEGTIIETTIDSWFFRDDQILIDTVTYGVEPYNLRNLINIKWEEPNNRVIISPKIQDFTNYTSLTLEMVIDSADELNEPETSQRFTIGLKDVDGNLSKLVLPENLNALDYTAGEVDFTPVFEENIYFWSVASPLSSINLPLSEFKEVDLKHIVAIEIIFDQTDSGSIYIDSILLQ